MSLSSYHPFFQSTLEKELKQSVLLLNTKALSGGDINLAAKLQTSSGIYFIKWQNTDVGDMFQKEAVGLELLRTSCTIDIPKTIGAGKVAGRGYLLLEYITPGSTSPNFWTSFGHALARLHDTTQKQFGLGYNNYIGRLPQQNTPHDNWPDFFITQRLEPQIKWGVDNKQIPPSFPKLLQPLSQKLSDLLPSEPPALIHGDLWSGNFMANDAGSAVIYDPAPYFGHREAELALTHLFGGFDQEFYQAYNNHSPITPGFDQRIDIYNLYPLLVHANLFGGGYLSQVKNILNRFT